MDKISIADFHETNNPRRKKSGGERWLCGQQAAALQKFPGHVIGAAAQYIGLIGHLHHVLVADLSGQQVQHRLQIGSGVGKFCKGVLPNQKGAVVIREEISVVLQNLQIGLAVETIGGIDNGDVEAALFRGGVF